MVIRVAMDVECPLESGWTWGKFSIANPTTGIFWEVGGNQRILRPSDNNQSSALIPKPWCCEDGALLVLLNIIDCKMFH